MITQPGSIRTVPLEQTAPPILERDKKMAALVKALAKLLQDHASLIYGSAGIYYRLNEQSEAMMDVLAADMKVDWYDYDFPLEIKRAIIQSAVNVHKSKGTRGAIATAISAIYDKAVIEEWFEYEGQPYRFRLRIDISEDEITSEKHQRVLENIKYYKNVRSIFEGAVYFMDRAATNHIYAGVAIRARKQIDVSCAVPVLIEIQYLADENADLLADENGNVLACDD